MRGLVRAGGLCAIVGGSLRIADSFTQAMLSAGMLALLYLVTDVFLLAGIAAIWWRRRAMLGLPGTAGVVIFIAGILAIRVAAFGVLGASGYLLGASVAVIGLAIYGIETLLRPSAAPWTPMLWLVSLACGIAGAAGIMPQAMTEAAGVAFGAGFVAAGVEVWRHSG